MNNLVGWKMFLIMHLRKEDRGTVHSYQYKMNAKSLRWLSLSFNTLTCAVVVNGVGRATYLEGNGVWPGGRGRGGVGS